MISIVTSYFNRRSQFINTLKSLELSRVKNFEVIAVDDASDEAESIKDLEKQFKFLKVHEIKKEEKWYNNPCIPFNIGFSLCNGDKIIIQNPECLHYSDILSRTEERLTDFNYLSFATYSIDETKTNEIYKNYNLENFLKNFQFDSNQAGINGINCWYNHGLYRPCAFHFCSAITRKNLYELNGFDEKYANGICYDDNEFLYRIQIKNLKIIFENHFIAIHQYHEPFNYNKKDGYALESKNAELFNSFTRRCLSYRANHENILNL